MPTQSVAEYDWAQNCEVMLGRESALEREIDTSVSAVGLTDEIKVEEFAL